MTVGTPVTARRCMRSTARIFVVSVHPSVVTTPVPRVDRDGKTIRVPVDEPADELGIVDRRGADHDARRAGLREGLGRVEIADAAAGLDLHGEAVRDRAEVIEVRGRAGARSIEVDDVKP